MSPAVIRFTNITTEFLSAFWTPNVGTFKMLMHVKARHPKSEMEKHDLGRLVEDAASQGWEDLIRHILTIGAPVDGRSYLWANPLAEACERGFEGIVRLLLEHGAKIHDITLAAAAKGGHLNVVRALLEYGADPNQGEPLPIISAISRERKDMFQELLGYGASLAGQNGVEAVKKAREEGLESMLALLEEHGVDIRE
ncbi:ankyrin [Lentithecium fluviatile CBS 122367]|uniref:Ankyrin n=1 Tax=Lentithecium fluviatile CBS 122367 TaxID=1168545 RepID=A0A6G1IDS7_9PLEO|nr:ankyrin [Lentithecium fluviatile CBS 122367]